MLLQISLDAETLLKIGGFVVGAITTAYNIVQLRRNPRAELKADLEILALLPPADAAAPLIRARIQRSIQALYSPTGRRRIITSPVDFWTGVGMMILFAGLALWVSRGGFSWWSVMWGLLAVGSFGGILNGMERKVAGKAAREAAPSAA